ncbi:hypothetical protein ACN20G_20515 [Streptomyces sp. BI20]|uniref:hypothetical protein n=1 Tax=Streptomyces sp. BI20 TaxID=3403460 RepID=UPI003C712234
MTAVTPATASDALRTRAEIDKIARVLGEAPADLAFLGRLPAADLAAFRERALAARHDSGPELLDRIAAATRLVPAAVAAAISEKALGPRLAAAVAGRLDPARAAEIISRLPAAFTAESCAHLDPRRIADIVARLDEDLLVDVAVTVAARADHVTMGRFVGRLPAPALARILDRIDDASLLSAGHYVDRLDALTPVVASLDDARLTRVVRTAAVEPALWPAALSVAELVDTAGRTRIATLAARLDPAELDAVVRVTDAEGLWGALLPLVALLPPAERAVVAELPALRDAAVLGRVVRTVLGLGLWAEFLPLADALPEEARRALAGQVGALEEAELDALAREVAARDLWEQVLPLVALMDDAAQTRILALPAFAEHTP